MNGKLAVLIPTFNGGDLLRRTVESCLGAGLDRSRYSVIVVDNCSSDGSGSGLSANVRIHRNERNLGRVGNWNRALAIAENAGFTYAALLFVGDEWIPNGSIGALLDSMDKNGSVLGMASLRIVNEEGSLLRAGARVTIRGTSAQVATSRLLAHSIGAGRLPFAPIQANVYRIFRERPLRFSTATEDALNGDIEATVQFLQDHPGSVSIQAAPYLTWKERSGRFFTAQDPWFVFSEGRRTLERLSSSTGIAVDWKNANAVAMLTALREPSPAIPAKKRRAFRLRALRYLLKDPAGLSFARVAGFIAKKLAFGQSYLDLSSEAEPDRALSSALQTVTDQCRS